MRTFGAAPSPHLWVVSACWLALAPTIAAVALSKAKKERVALSVDLATAGRREGLSQEALVLVQQLGVPRGPERPQQASRASTSAKTNVTTPLVKSGIGARRATPRAAACQPRQWNRAVASWRLRQPRPLRRRDALPLYRLPFT